MAIPSSQNICLGYCTSFWLNDLALTAVNPQKAKFMAMAKIWCTIDEILMASLTKVLASSSPSGKLRPVDVRRDLNPVADLMERSFSETLEPDGQRYSPQMRSAAYNPGFLLWAGVL